MFAISCKPLHYSKTNLNTLLRKIKGTWSASSLVCGHSQVQLLEGMHNCTSLKSLIFKKQLTLHVLAMSWTQPWHLFNPFASGIQKVLLSHITGLFSVKSRKNFYPLKISLSMIRCPDNQINASFIDISRIKWLVFLLWSSFFRTTSTVASSEAPADYQHAPGRTDGIPERHQRQWIIRPSL